MAELFSDPPTSFALYWTDLSYENFAVDSQGKVRIVDAENIIVVDKWKLKLGTAAVMQTSKHVVC